MNWFEGPKKQKWFYDKIRGYGCGLEIKKVLYEKKNRFQKVKILESKTWGRVLTLDETIQTTERDEFIYHEMISHVPLFLHKNPKEVLIIGGGDGGVLREVLRHKIRKAFLVEIDKYVIEASKKYLPKIHQNSFYNKRAEVIVGDGIDFISRHKNAFDVIIIDSTDPVGAAEGLFRYKFYRDALSALRAGGFLVTQSGAIFSQWEEFSKTIRKMKRFFRHVSPYWTCIPTYPSSFWSFTITSKDFDFRNIPFQKIKKRYRKIKGRFKIYSPEMHRASFTIPDFITKGLNK
jgi:spermidine synthase